MLNETAVYLFESVRLYFALLIVYNIRYELTLWLWMACCVGS